MTTQKPVYIASDVHFGSAPPGREEAFLAWLERSAGAASLIVLNGDLFDFWFEYRTGTSRGYDRVLDCLRAVVAGGVGVTLMGGNHDWWGGRYLREEVGVEFLQNPVVRDYAGLRTFLAHGDGLGKGDLGYHALRFLLRGRLTRFAFWLLTPSVGDGIAARVTRTEDHWGEPTAYDRARAAAQEDWAVARLLAEPDLDLVVLGHTHIPVLRPVGPGRWYLNAGDWVRHSSYAVLEEGRPPRLLTWEA